MLARLSYQLCSDRTYQTSKNSMINSVPPRPFTSVIFVMLLFRPRKVSLCINVGANGPLNQKIASASLIAMNRQVHYEYENWHCIYAKNLVNMGAHVTAWVVRGGGRMQWGCDSEGLDWPQVRSEFRKVDFDLEIIWTYFTDLKWQSSIAHLWCRFKSVRSKRRVSGTIDVF